MEQEIFELLGKVITWVASGATGAFFLIKFWGEKWIENKFLKELELFKAQKLHELNLLLTRKTKWHEKEHEVLSESWKKLIKAHESLQVAISFFRQCPDLNEYSVEELERFMNDHQLSNREKAFMKDSRKDYTSAFSKILDHRTLNDAKAAFREFHTYFEENKIFLRPHIKEKFLTVDDHIWSAWVSWKMELRGTRREEDLGMVAFEKENNEIKPLIKDIENIIQKELFPEQLEIEKN